MSQAAFCQERNSLDLRRHTLASPIPSSSSGENSVCQQCRDTVSVSSGAESTAVDDDDSYFLEALERWNFSQITHTFWADTNTVFDKFNPSAANLTSNVHEYEGTFLAALFDATNRICETGVAKSLMLARLLGKVAILADERVDWIVCNWSSLPARSDDLAYTQYEKSCNELQVGRRTIHGIMEKMTFEALKRARTIPKFETKLRAAKEKGKSSTELLQVAVGITESVKSDASIYKQISRRTSFTQLLFNSVNSPPVSPTPSEPTTPSSPTSAFFQYPPTRTPITLTNPFAKLPEFLTGYILLQEFCKEIAATVMVKYVISGELNEQDSIGIDGSLTGSVHPLDLLE